MSSTIPSGATVIAHAALTGSSFTDVCPGDSTLDNVSLANARLHDVNMTHSVIDYVNLRKAKFIDCDFANVEITKSRMNGMTIDGVPVSDALALYRQRHGA